MIYKGQKALISIQVLSNFCLSSALSMVDIYLSVCHHVSKEAYDKVKEARVRKINFCPLLCQLLISICPSFCLSVCLSLSIACQVGTSRAIECVLFTIECILLL